MPGAVHSLRSVAASLGAIAAAACATTGPASAGEVLYATEGNRMLRIALGAAGGGEPEVFIERASEQKPGGAAVGPGRDVNGMICAFPDGSGRFVAGEDTGQPEIPPGWGVFSPAGVQIGKLTTTYYVAQGEPYGCAFDGAGRLFTTEVGNQGFGRSLGQLILWFPPYAAFPGASGSHPVAGAVSKNFCKLATDIGTAGAVAVDAEGRVYVASASRGAILRFSPPFPSSPDASGGCGATDELGSPLADVVAREVFARGLYTFSGLAFGPDGLLYAASVLTGEIVAIDANGDVVRKILIPARAAAADRNRSSAGDRLRRHGEPLLRRSRPRLGLPRHRSRTERQAAPHPLRRRRAPAAPGDSRRRSGVSRRRGRHAGQVSRCAAARLCWG